MAGMQAFFQYLGRESLTPPTKRDHMDALVSDYLEHLWSEGEGTATASNLLAALQDSQTKLKGAVPGAWRLMKTWSINEVPQRAPPLSEGVLNAMIGWSIMHEHYSIFFCVKSVSSFSWSITHWGIVGATGLANSHHRSCLHGSH